jgi:hypothetical protein
MVKCYIALGNKDEARKWAASAEAIPTENADDEAAAAELIVLKKSL